MTAAGHKSVPQATAQRLGGRQHWAMAQAERSRCRRAGLSTPIRRAKPGDTRSGTATAHRPVPKVQGTRKPYHLFSGPWKRQTQVRWPHKSWVTAPQGPTQAEWRGFPCLLHSSSTGYSTGARQGCPKIAPARAAWRLQPAAARQQPGFRAHTLRRLPTHTAHFAEAENSPALPRHHRGKGSWLM